MTIEQLKKETHDGKVCGVYFFYGECGYLIRHYTGLIREKLGVDDFNVISLDKMDIENARMILQTPPAFCDKKLLIYKNTGFLKSSRAEEREFWEENLPDLPDYITVIFIEENIDKRYKKLISAAESSGAVVEFENLSFPQLRAWVNILVKKNGGSIDAATADYLISNCPADMYIIESEVNKLCSYSRDVITADDIDKCVTKPAANRIYDISRAILNRNPGEAFAILGDLKKLREEPVGIMALLCANFCNICKIKMSKGDSVTPQSLGVHPYALSKMREDAARVEQTRIDALVGYSLTCDSMLKSSAVDKWIQLEMFVGKAML